MPGKKTYSGEQSPTAAPTFRSARIVDEVTAYLRNLILDHEITPGTFLLQTEWSERLGVSRTPLREAFRLLESDGLVRPVNGNRSVQVVRYTADELRELYELREMIDGLAARLLAVHGVPADVNAQLSDLLDEMEAASDPFHSSAYFAAHTKFHVCIATNCGNRRLIPMLGLIRSTCMSLHQPMADEPPESDDLAMILDVARVHHRDIYEAIVAGDGTKAERAARKHIASTLRSDMILRATGQKPREEAS